MSRANVQESLELRRRRAEAKNYLKWGVINIVVFAVLAFDICQACVSDNSLWYYAEYTFGVLSFLSAVACIGKYIFWRVIVNSGPVSVTELQRCLLDETNGKLICRSINRYNYKNS